MKKSMTFMYSKKFRICLLALVLFLFQGKAFGDEIFTIPENLKDNVAFWMKIYSEVSLKEGVIHDKNYPMIIYRMIRIGDRTGKARRSYIKENMAAVERLLENMVQKSPDQWTGIELQVAELFKQYAGIDEIKDAASRVRFQLGQKERFKEGLERAAAYMPYIFSIFEKYNIPKRIAYLPHVESSFNLNAYSKVGAAGMWQFMRGTGRIFHLKMDYKIDERRDPIKSTIAAAQLLSNNFANLQSWPLAITAYNHGPESIRRAVEMTGSRDLGVIIDKYENRRFKFASKNFYGCFIAASEIAANPGKYFSNILPQPPLKYSEIQVKKSMKPQALANRLGISEYKLRELNPALRPIVFTRQIPIPADFMLRIPDSTIKPVISAPIPDTPAVKPTAPISTKPIGKMNGDIFDATLYNLDIELIPGKNQAIVTVSMNESFGHFADWLKVPIETIRRLNPGKRQIQVNQRINIPINEGDLEQFKTTRLEYHLALEEDFYSQYQVIDTKKRAVKNGDTLWGICNRDEEIPLWLLKKFNREITLEELKINTLLIIPVITSKMNGNGNGNGNNNSNGK